MRFVFVCLMLVLLPQLFAVEISQNIQQQISRYLTQQVKNEVHIDTVKIDSVTIVKKSVNIYAGKQLSYIPFTNDKLAAIYAHVKSKLPKEYHNYQLNIYSDSYKIDDYIALDRKDKFANRIVKPLVTNVSRPYSANRGLQNHHMALWQSHGWYYEQKLARWEWQRARVFQTVEDLYTQSYVLPYLVPMLENAGANVLLPRERDTQSFEVIVDNDKGIDVLSVYKETNGKETWAKGQGFGFAHLKGEYLDGENPFEQGSYRCIKTVKNAKDESVAEWNPSIPRKGKYAVYVSYKTLEDSPEDALYTVHHLGGKTDFKVNQQMGGGTWIFLDFFDFDEGVNNSGKVSLSNQSSKNGKTLTADAVKIGGGMGNMARLPHKSGVVTENVKSSESTTVVEKQMPEIDYQPELSGRPRYTEAARYWLQWAGVPDSVYTKSEGKNDYTDDYQSRGYWVNYLVGGSSALPHSKGLNIPVDLAMAFHTDAGTTYNDSIIGTLGICMTHENDELFANSKPRIHSRDLTAVIMDQIVQDIRLQYEPDWTRRQIWNRSYSEARIPEVPTMLLELLSHQNFADMRYGLDPRFQFTVSRSVYKGILKFIANQYGYDYVVQPLPVKSFSTQFVGKNTVKLQWQPVTDPVEPTAMPDKYIVYTRIGDGGFDNGRVVDYPYIDIDIDSDKLYGFKVAALNSGGESFPSEILSVYRNSQDKGDVLIINGFDRLSAPFGFTTSDSIAGFVDAIDHGVPDKIQYNYIGSQYEYRRQIPWMDDDAPGFGASNADFETTVVAGNSFDYPALHGKSIVKAGYSFVSTSVASVMDGHTDINKYKLIDLILGKQKQTKIGRGAFDSEFKTFPQPLQDKISTYCRQGGNVFVSGAFVASDLWDTDQPKESDQQFAQEVLKYKWRVGQAAVKGKVKTVASPFPDFKGNYDFYTDLNSVSYAAESPDAIEPANDDNSFTIIRYTENNLSAGVASNDKYKTVILGFPFETIKEQDKRDELMSGILSFIFSEKK